jgi:carboxylesterase type B
MLIAPLAKGLVHRMIYRSGSAFRGIRTLAEAETAGLAVGNDLEALRALPAADVLKLNGVVDPANHPDVPGVRPLLNVPFLRPIVDGYVFDRTDVEAYFSGAFAAVPSIVGNVTSESGGAITANIPIDTAAALRLHLQESFGDEFEEAWRLFGTENDAEARQKLVEVWMDNRYSFAVRALGREIAKRQPKTFRYLFSHAGTHTANPPVHGNDMTYVFGTGDFDARDRVISDAILAAFSNFAATGDPNGPGAPHWSPYDPAQENYLTLGGNLEEGSHWRTEQAAFFENYFLR